MPDVAVVIDGNALMYRAYYATQSGKDDEKAESDFYFTLSSLRITVDKILNQFEKVCYAAVAFDTSKHNFRKEKFSSYKSNRRSMPTPLLKNLEKIREVFVDLGMVIVDAPHNYEGDDAIATLSTIFTEHGVNTFIFSTDKDLLQLVSENVSVFIIRKSQ